MCYVFLCAQMFKNEPFFFCLAFSRLLGKTPAAEYSLCCALVYVDLTINAHLVKVQQSAATAFFSNFVY